MGKADDIGQSVDGIVDSRRLAIQHIQTRPCNDAVQQRLRQRSLIDNAEMTVAGSILTITGLVTGESTSVIYASDLNELIQSNTFTITVLGNANATNGSATETTSPIITTSSSTGAT